MSLFTLFPNSGVDNVGHYGSAQMKSAKRGDPEPMRTLHCVTGIRRMTQENAMLVNNDNVYYIIVHCILLNALIWKTRKKRVIPPLQ